MLSAPYNRVKFAQKPASALVPVSKIRPGDFIDLGVRYGGFGGGLLHVGEVSTYGDGTTTISQGGRHFCSYDEVTDIPADAQFVVFRKHFPGRK